jgi:muramoyltetrapeptide carboxypeptidase LdcA involved in peptidoglycan recycling
VLEEFAGAFKKPIISGLPFGHVTRKMTLPVGVRVRVTTESTSVEILESAVA